MYIAVSIDELSTTSRSVSISWTTTDAVVYFVTIMGSFSTTSQEYTISIRVHGINELEYGGLLPEQSYEVRLFDEEGYILSCTNIQTSASEVSSDSKLVGGILGSIIALLVLLLIIVLAYTRCIRPRVKDKKYLSRLAR